MAVHSCASQSFASLLYMKTCQVVAVDPNVGIQPPVHHANVELVTKDVDSDVAINTKVTAPLGPRVRASDVLTFANSGEGNWFIFQTLY